MAIILTIRNLVVTTSSPRLHTLFRIFRAFRLAMGRAAVRAGAVAHGLGRFKHNIFAHYYTARLISLGSVGHPHCQ